MQDVVFVTGSQTAELARERIKLGVKTDSANYRTDGPGDPLDHSSVQCHVTKQEVLYEVVTR